MSETEFDLAGLEESLRRHLPQYTGTIITEDLIQVIRAGASWGEHIKETLQQELHEWLQQDLDLLPGRDQVQQFIAQVGEFESEVKQMEKRMEQLQPGDKK
jgi:ubiquinone biosynthesis protein UbiJ